MPDKIGTAIIAIGTAIIGVAILAVLLSKNSQTSQVVSSVGSAFGNVLAVAISPISGATVTPNLAGSGSSGFGSFTNGSSGSSLSPSDLASFASLAEIFA